MKCPKCNAEIPDRSKVCTKCGHVILDEPQAQTNDPAHETSYYGGFSQNVSGANRTTNISSGASYANQKQLNPYKTMIVLLIVSLVAGVAGLIVGITSQGIPSNDDSFILAFIGSFVLSFFAIFLTLFGYLLNQFKIFKEHKPSEFKDWIPTILFVISIGVSATAVVFAIKLFAVMLA